MAGPYQISPLEGTLASWAVWPAQLVRPNKLTWYMPPREGDEHCWKTPACHAILRLAGSNRTNKRRGMLKWQRKKWPVCTDLPQKWSLPSRNKATGASDKREALEVMCLNKKGTKYVWKYILMVRAIIFLEFPKCILRKSPNGAAEACLHKQTRYLHIWMEVSGKALLGRVWTTIVVFKLFCETLGFFKCYSRSLPNIWFTNTLTLFLKT